MPSSRRTATVLFLDIVGSTGVAAELGDARFRELISRFNRIVTGHLRRHGGREEDRAGDGFFATFPEPAQAIRCACALSEDVRELGIEIRSGIHTGETERVDGKTQLFRFDPRTGHVDRTKDLSPIDAIAAGPGGVWTSDVLEGTVTRFDPETMEPADSIEIPGGADILELDGSDLWVLTQNAGLVTPVLGGQRGPQIRVGEDPTSLAAGLGAIWVGDEDGIIRRIDRETRQVEKLSVEAPIRAIDVDEEENTLWVDVP